MIRQDINLDGYWLATIFYLPMERDMPTVAEALCRLGCPEEDIAKTWHYMTGEWNKGFTWSNPARRRSITIIGRALNWSEFYNTVNHETRHIVDEVIAAYHVLNYGEPPAYTQGEIARQMAPVIRRFACPCCGLEK